MTLNLSWLDDFMALAATGNFSRAADERHMTQPAFSRRVRALEEWLGAELFDRSSQPARLTETGHWFRSIAQDLQADVARIPGEARAIAEASSATLRFAATHALSFTYLPRWLNALEARTAMGPVQLLSDAQQKCEALLLQSQVQFVLSHGHAQVRSALDEAGCPSLQLGVDRLIPVSAPDPQGQPLHPLISDSAAQVLSYGGESGLGKILHELKGAALAKLPVQQVFTAQLASVLRTMALDGRGLAWLPRLLVEDDLALGRLVPAAGEDWQIDLEIRLHRDRSPLGPAAEAFWAAASSSVSG